MIKMILRTALTLFLITAVAGFGLGLIYAATEEKIAQVEDSKTAQGLAAVLPGYEVDLSIVHKVDGISYWIGEKPEGNTAYAFIAKKTGYSSEVQTMVGIDEEGTLLGISVLFQQETPGLGARVQEVPSAGSFVQWITGRLPESSGPRIPWFAEQFRGLNASKAIDIRKGSEWNTLSSEQKKQLSEANAITALSGATITTRAISESIEEAAAKILSVVKENPSKADESS